MKPTRIYTDLILNIKKKVHIKGMAHITGGGLLENIPRILPNGMGVELLESRLPKVKLFKQIQEASNLKLREMISVFNVGIGFVLCINEKDLSLLDKIFKAKKERIYILGKVIKKPEFRVV